jgi:hypothetical protein
MVEPVNSSLGKMLLEEISPVVMVLCTPLVEDTFLRNGLSFVETLKPFCNFSNIDGEFLDLMLIVFRVYYPKRLI